MYEGKEGGRGGGVLGWEMTEREGSRGTHRVTVSSF